MQQRDRFEHSCRNSQEANLQAKLQIKEKQIYSLNEQLMIVTASCKDQVAKHSAEVELLTNQLEASKKQCLDITAKYTKLLVDHEWVQGQYQKCRQDIDQKSKEYDAML